MKNRFTVIEISHKYIKIAIISVVEGKLVVHYAKKHAIPQCIEGGAIRDKATLLKALSKINPINDDGLHIHELISESILVLPPYGYEIYTTKQSTPVMAKEHIVQYQDIRNLYSLISNKKLPVDNELIDIIPEYFLIDNQDKYAVPPIGKETRGIFVAAYVHTLPKKINADYSDLLLRSGIKISHRIVSSYALSELLINDTNVPSSFYLVDLGANTTNVTLVGENRIFGSRSFGWGGDNITERIIECFNINEKEAESIKNLFGYDTRKMDFDYKLSSNGHKREDLNKIITESLDRLMNSLSVCLENLANVYQVDNYQDLPIFFVGGASKLHGMLDYMKEKYEKDNIYLYHSKVLGARDPSLYALIGAALINNKYPGVVEEINDYTSPVSRED